MQTLIKKVLGLAALFVAAIRSELGQIGGAGISIPRSALVKPVIAPIDLATGATNSASLDTQKCRHVDFFVPVGVISGTVDVKVQDSADDSSWADLSPAVAITQMAATDDGKMPVISVKEGSHRRYVRVVVTITGGTASFGAAIAIGYPVLGESPPTLDALVPEVVEG